MADSVTARLTRAIRFGSQLLRASGASLGRLRLTLAQLYTMLVRSCVPMALAGLFVGMVLAVQGGSALGRLGGAGGALVALPLVRELGPVFAALLFAGAVGSALAAEVGRMKANEQLAALEMMAIDPYRRVLAPRFAASLIAMPLLATLFAAAGLGGGYMVMVGLQGVEPAMFWSHIPANGALGREIGAGLLKSAIFGAAASGIALFEGSDAAAGNEGVSRASRRAVVYGALAVLGLDVIVNALAFA